MAALNGGDKSTSKRFLRGEIMPDLDPTFEPKRIRVDSGNYSPTIVDDMPMFTDHDIKGDLYSRVLVFYTGGTIGMKSVDGVLCPIPHYLVTVLRTMPMFYDSKYAEQINLTQDSNLEPLIMPETKDGRRIIYHVYEYEPVVDSCNITMTNWMRIAHDIRHNYANFDGFVILHGTDTMAYSASALSFIIENLGKPVILTGSQIPIFEIRSDGRDNFLGALIMAGTYCLPEVMVYFNNKLLRGCRVLKSDAGSFNAFITPNMAPLAELEIDIHVHWDAVFKSGMLAKISTAEQLCPHVGVLRFFPGITEATVSHFLAPPMKGVVLQSYGSGNGPDSRKDLLALFRQACERGVIIVNITQCTRGSVSTSYAAGKALLDVGIIQGADMTPEAALTKLAYILGKDDWSHEKKRKMMGVSLRGEMKVLQDNQEEGEQKMLDIPLLSRLKEAMGLASKEELAILKAGLVPNLLCAAAKDGNISALEALQGAGVGFGSPDFDGRTALHVACSEGHTHAVCYLLKHGSLVHAKDRYGITPLEDAINFNKHEIITIIMKTGGHLKMHPYKLGIELCLAAAKGNSETLVSFALAEADLNQGDYDGRTALHIAVSHGSDECISTLKKYGAKVDIEDKFGKTPMDDARRMGREDLLELLKDWPSQKE